MSGGSLRKTLGMADVFCISAGAMISSGIFVLPGVAYENIGPAVFLAYGFAGICALVGTLATIELATAMPLAGGIYYYTGRSLGPLAGTISGLLNWSAIALKSSFAIFGMSEVVYQFFGINPIYCGIGLTLIFLLVNLLGTKSAALAQVIMVALLFISLGAYICLGFPELKPSRFEPFFQPGKGFLSLFAEAAFVFVSFGGLLDVASISEEVKNPRRNLPEGMIGATLAVMITYVLVLIVTVGVLEPSELSGSLTPLADAAEKYYGTPGMVIITLGAVMAFVTTANAGVMAAARFPYAMGRDKLVPEFFSRTYGSRHMPLPALLITGAFMILAQLLPLEKLVTVASTVIMLSFILTNISVIILRESEIQNYRPSFRVPFYPVVPILSMVIFCLLIMELGVGSVRISIGIIIIGILLYFVFGRKVNLEYALMHLVRRLMKTTVPQPRELERELRDIIRERDQIVEDEFDRTVEVAEVIIDDAPRKFTELCRSVCGDDELSAQLIAREEESSTVLTPEVAIPHITIPGEGVLKLVIVRNMSGVYFRPDADSVKTVIFLFVTGDKRNMYLKSLAAIAQIIQSPSFEKRWARANNEEKIRDLLLLSKRRRYHHQARD